MRCKARSYILTSLVVLLVLGWLSSRYLKSTPTAVHRTPSVQAIIPNNRRSNGALAPQALPIPIANNEIAGDLSQVLSTLLRLQRESSSPHIAHSLHEPISQMRQALTKLSLPVPDVATNTSLSRKLPKKLPRKDVCPEKFTSKDLSGGYPFFYKGFNSLNCTDVPRFSAIVTAIFNFVHLTSLSPSNMAAMVKQVHKEYSRIPILVAVSDSNVKQLKALIRNIHVSIISVSTSMAETDIWNTLLDKANTRYVFVARNVVHFSWHSRLERLVREIQGLQASVVAGSYRYMDGLWNYGCHQTSMKNYTLVYTKGYDWSRHECMVCDSVGGPFIAETTTLREHTLPSAMNDVSGFEVWFQELKTNKRLVVTCPDAMFFVSKAMVEHKKSWKDLARHYEVELIKIPPNREFRFSCSEVGMECKRERGVALSHCCLQDLSLMIKTFFQLCKEAGCLCEMQEGTLLGAVKFNGILPWERDADVTFHTANFSAIEKLEHKFRQHGYTLSSHKEPWCCVDGVKAGGVFNLVSESWNVEIYGQHLMDSEKLLLQGIPPTEVEMDGVRIPSPASPGLFCRNRYGYEIYQHAQHWMTLSQTSGWAFYKPSHFSECPQPGYHACLDQYAADGNIQFRSKQP